MFIDETVIRVKAGDGGNGCYAHDRQKYIPKGRPSGGSGGRGGHVIVEVSSQLHTLQDVAYHRSYKAERGAHGQGSQKTGRSGGDIILPVPLGTIIQDAETDEILLDCIHEGKKHIIARGGRGGRGNFVLANPRNPNPERCEAGKPGESRKLRMVLKVLADVGLVGRPNAGKSTFLSRISRAHPKIADYPFTTTAPNLGIVRINDYDTFVVADIPGLIEGSHEGKGLGIQFLKHIERTRVLAIMVESTAEDPLSDAQQLLNELTLYSPLLAEKPKCFILTKNDITAENCADCPEGWFSISAVTGEGVQKVLRAFKGLLDTHAE
ncbi:MAG: Obg family GTPase CgtA [Chitinivibrionales bacterium]